MSQVPTMRGIIQKTPYVRSKAHMTVARTMPCGNCDADDGTVCGAHPNWSWADKGKSIKANDIVASLCFNCHSLLDQGSKLTRAEREEMWLKAFYKTMLHGFRSGKFVVVG